MKTITKKLAKSYQRYGFCKGLLVGFLSGAAIVITWLLINS